MKFCSECGSKLPTETTKFCSNCGTNLSAIGTGNTTATNLPPKQAIESISNLQEPAGQNETTVITATIGEEEIAEEKPMSAHKLGINLEDMTEKIHQSMGYTTQRRQRLPDKDGVKHEIDIYATKGNRVRAVECKNYDASRAIGIKELRDFHSKVAALKIKDALFVTNTVYSSESEKFANSRNIILWDGDELKERFFSMTLGRLGTGQQTILELALPINATYEEVSRFELANPELTKMQTRLIFHPYYRFEWKLDIVRHNPAHGKHRLQAAGIFIVDALDGEVINPKENISSKLSGLFKRGEEKLAKREEKQIIHDLIEMKPESKYNVYQTSEYAVSQLRPTVKTETAQKTVIQQAIDETKREETYEVRTRNGEETKSIFIIAKPNEVIIKKAALIYVPKWNLDIESGQITFMRKALAASKTVLVDTISYCPRHLSIGDVQLVKKQTAAICEICGGAFCQEHIFQVDGKYFCEEHNPNKPTPEQTKTESSIDSGIKKAASKWGSLFK